MDRAGGRSFTGNVTDEGPAENPRQAKLLLNFMGLRLEIGRSAGPGLVPAVIFCQSEA